MTDLGTPEAVEGLVEPYLGAVPPTVLRDDTNALLAALLMEAQTQRYAGSGPDDVVTFLRQQRRDLETGAAADPATYHASEPTVAETNTGSNTENGWQLIDLGFTATEIDLRRLSAGIRVAFADPAGEATVVRYNAEDSPLAGIPVTTDTVWVRSQPGAGTQTIRVEAWP